MTVYIGIRPADTGYNRLYWSTATPDIVHPHFFGTTYQGTVESFISLLGNDDLLMKHLVGSLDLPLRFGLPY